MTQMQAPPVPATAPAPPARSEDVPRLLDRLQVLVVVACVLFGALAALLLYAQAGGDLKPLRVVKDPFPVFTDVAVDAEANIVSPNSEHLDFDLVSDYELLVLFPRHY